MSGTPSGPVILIVSRDNEAVKLMNHRLSRAFPRHLIKVAHRKDAIADLISRHNTQCVVFELTDAPQSQRLLQELRAQSPQIQVVVLSRAEAIIGAAEAQKLGIVDCLPLSDLNGKTLADTVRLAMRRSSIESRFPLRESDIGASDQPGNNLNELVFVIRSGDGQIVDVGEAGLSVFGLSPNDVVGQKLGNVGLLGRGGQWKATLESCASSGESREILVAEHGLRRKFSVRAKSESYCGSKHYFVVARDLSSGDGARQTDFSRKKSIDLQTGIANRASFDERLGLGNGENSLETPKFGGLLRIELDGLPNIKAQSGDLVAERQLRLLALTLDQSVRQASDLVARYSENQFAVIVEDIEPGNVIGVADRLVKRVRKLDFGSGSANATSVSISVGAAAGNIGQTSTRTELFASAEFALRQASERGDRAVAVQIAE